LTKIRRQTVADDSVVVLRNRILDGELRPGCAVTEEAMAKELGVSRATMRQALNTLMLEGLLTRHATTRVLQVTTLSHSDLADIYRARRFLELGGVDAAATKSAEDLLPLKEAVHDMERAVDDGDLPAFVNADYRCHAEIVALLDSRYLSEAHALLMSKLRLAITQVTTDEQDNDEVLARHQQFRDYVLSGQIDEARANLVARLDEAEKAVSVKATEKA
jgi:DNA-binding GntR family transcriptional regulator